MKFKFSTFTILTIFGCLSIIGFSLIPLLNVQLMPGQEKSSLSVSYRWKDASAKVIEKEVTSKLEGVFNTVKGIKSIRSTSGKGRGRISLTYKKNSDKDALRFELSNLIRQSYEDLPEGVSYPSLSVSFSDDLDDSKKSILSYSINANQSPYFIKKYAEKKLIPRLSEIKGVNQVNINGITPYEWVIEYDTDQMLQLNMNANDISKAISTHFNIRQIGIGSFTSNDQTQNQEKSLILKFHNDKEVDWTRIPVKKIGHRIIYLNAIAKIAFREAEVERYYRTNGLNSVSLVIYPEKEINTIILAKSVREIIDNLKEELFEEGYSLKLTNDTTEFLSEEIEKIERRTLYSLLILLVLILLINRSIRYMFVLFLSVLANLSIAVILYTLLDVELHMYSFAGITISFGIIIDNSIIMIDHLKNKGDKKVFLAILAATMTTIAALLIIVFLKEDQRINLWDFSLVIGCNIAVSLTVSLYFVPALLQKINLKNSNRVFSRKRKMRILKLTKFYEKFMLFFKKRSIKWVFVLIFIFGFGIPLHLFPEKLEGEGFEVEMYNDTFGDKWFLKELKPTLEKIIGGALRLFTEDVFENSYNSDPEKTVLRVSGDMPEGCTIKQLNEVVQRMENLISEYDEVELYETKITSPQNSSISIYFKEEHEFTGFPYSLKDILESKAVSLGGADWSVTGVGQGFSNALRDDYKSQRITLEGYNYDQLYGYAEELKIQLLENSKGRVKEVEITNGGRRSSKALSEFYLEFYLGKMADLDVTQNGIYSFLKNQVYYENVTSIVYENELHNVKLVADAYKDFNVWDLNNSPLWIRNKQYKLKQLATIDKRKTGNTISKNNQQYNLTVAYDFIGTYQLANKFRKENSKDFKATLPIGFRIGNSSGSWNKEGVNQYYSLLIVILIIFFICSILLESLAQPFAIISMIPISFIGVFITFYFFEFNFDQGGYASFILLAGISVNSSLYLINDFNNLKKQFPRQRLSTLYFKAFNYKIIPILLTIFSTIAGLIPFLWGGEKEAFWFSFAVGSIGGLVFSLLGILFYLPLFIKLKTKKNEKVFY